MDLQMSYRSFGISKDQTVDCLFVINCLDMAHLLRNSQFNLVVWGI